MDFPVYNRPDRNTFNRSVADPNYQKRRRGERIRYDGSSRFPVPASPEETRQYRQRLFNKTKQKQRFDDTAPNRYFDVDLGNKDLPIYSYKEQIIDAIARNQVTIIVAETGAGKSTQVPQFLLEYGYQPILTQPRRLAADKIGERIQSEVTESLRGGGLIGCPDLVGVQTAEYNSITSNSRIRVVTDGLKMATDIATGQRLENEVAIVDEFHERNSNEDILLAWTKEDLLDNPDLRLVIMSATLDDDELSEYFKNIEVTPEVIKVPGRTYGIEKREAPSSDVVKEAYNFASQGIDTMVFLPGVREIEDTIKNLKKCFTKQELQGYQFIPLHSKLSRAEQALADAKEEGKTRIICATNVAQTSITIDGIDAVVACGEERRIEVDQEGIEGLVRRPASRADLDQQMGRTGRTAPGRYVLTKLPGRHEKFISYNSPERQNYPTPEILRTDPSRNILRTAAKGKDFTELDLLNPLSPSVLDRGKHKLRDHLGALDENYKITKRGRRMNQFPISPSLSRMLVEAEEQGMSDSAKCQLAAITAVTETGDLRDWVKKGSVEKWEDLTYEKESDHIALLDIFREARNEMTDNPDNYTKILTKEMGLDEKIFDRANETYEKIIRKLGIEYRLNREIPFTNYDTGYDRDREAVIRCITAGLIDSIYVRRSETEYMRFAGRSATLREIANRSFVSDARRLPRFVAANPYSLELRKDGQIEELPVIQNVTATTNQLIGAISTYLASNLESIGPTEYRIKGHKILQIHRDEFGQETESVASPTDEEARELLISYALEHPGRAHRELRQIKETRNMSQGEYMEFLSLAASKVTVMDVQLFDVTLGQEILARNLYD